ncbi:hypothetical protein F511_05470 [Dorcoceras hygrometricum]|uniref:O-fucosyltransferase family protein n=1 Tax=Dorcoceras hygrometricum TaxID=472368 RepID=A0A2Z7BHF7_9LAMI|nr:hypothetical protein F511_05470 [Dorcoceras hygrometricum]
MLSLSPVNLCRGRRFRRDILGQNALTLLRNLCFALFAIGVLVFTVMAVSYTPNNQLFHPFSKITNFFTPTLNATLDTDDTVMGNGVGLLVTNGSDSGGEIDSVVHDCRGKVDEPIECGNPDVFLLLMRSAMDTFKDIQIYRFGKPVKGNNDSSCHMGWRYKPKEANSTALYKDYRSFELLRLENCTFSLVGIGDSGSGENAKKKKSKGMEANPIVLPEAWEVVNDTFSEMGSKDSFSRGKYLIYSGGKDRCKNMDQYLWSFLCMLGEAQYLNRTLVMDLSICLSKMYTSSGQDEEGKDFRFYFDFEHLLDSASVVDQAEFWSDWNIFRQKDGLTLHFVENHSKVTPMKLARVKDTLIMRKFGNVKSSNNWFQVCEGEASSVIERPWHMIWKSRPLVDVALAVGARMKWDYDAVHVERREKAKKKESWPNLDKDTSPESLLATLKDKIEDGRDLYISTDEPNKSFFDPLKSKYSTHFLDEYKDLWNVDSDWYAETTKLTFGKPVEFDGFMKISVDSEVLLRGKRHIETFNDLTKDCKNGINTC